MASELNRMTKLEAVNTMLTTIGEFPIENLDDLAGHSDAGIAKTILENSSRTVQSKGWVFNTDLKKELTVTDSTVRLGSNVLRVDTTSKVRTTTKDIVERGGYLYDRENNTFNFTDSTIEVDLVLYLPFDDLPEVARRYIAIKSARIFHDRIVGSGELHRFFQDDEIQAWSDLVEYEGEVGDYTIFDDYDVYRVLDRT